MNFPAVAKQTYEKLRSRPVFSNITQFIIDHLKKISSPLERARFVHHVVDEYNREVFTHPIVQKFLPCKAGCSNCCHTQVGITMDEAELLVGKINEDIKIDYALLEKQIKVGNNSESFFKLSYEDRKCIFLGKDNNCQVYNDRPSVCRTNAVLGDAIQCAPENSDEGTQILRLVKTEQADMAIMGSFLMSKENGAIAYMIGQILEKTKATLRLKEEGVKERSKDSNLQKKSISIDRDL